MVNWGKFSKPKAERVGFLGFRLRASEIVLFGPRCRCAPQSRSVRSPLSSISRAAGSIPGPRRDSPPSPRQGAAFGPMQRESRRFAAGWPGTRGGRSTTDRVGKDAIGLGYPKCWGVCELFWALVPHYRRGYEEGGAPSNVHICFALVWSAFRVQRGGAGSGISSTTNPRLWCLA